MWAAARRQAQQQQLWGRVAHALVPCKRVAVCRRVGQPQPRRASTDSAESELLARAKRAIEADPNFAERLVSELQPGARRAVLRSLENAGATTATATEAAAAGAAPTVSRQQLKATALFIGIPMVGFGFMDNMIMLVAGDQIEAQLGVSLGMTTLCAAGLGNLISDIAGLGLGGYIEASAGKLGISSPKLSHAQEALGPVRRVRAAANVIGISVGCLLGMCPLLFIDEDKRKLYGLFRSMDADGSGTITKEELRSGLRSLGASMPDGEMDQVFASVDTDNSGEIDFDEFRAFVESRRHADPIFFK